MYRPLCKRADHVYPIIRRGISDKDTFSVFSCHREADFKLLLITVCNYGSLAPASSVKLTNTTAGQKYRNARYAPLATPKPSACDITEHTRRDHAWLYWLVPVSFYQYQRKTQVSTQNIRTRTKALVSDTRYGQHVVLLPKETRFVLHFWLKYCLNTHW